MSLTIAEKYARRIRRLHRAALVGNWITAVVSAVFIPVELYAGRPLHAIYFLLFLWSACRDLASSRRKVITITFDVDTSGFDAATTHLRRSISVRPTLPAEGTTPT